MNHAYIPQSIQIKHTPGKVNRKILYNKQNEHTNQLWSTRLHLNKITERSILIITDRKVSFEYVYLFFMRTCNAINP